MRSFRLMFGLALALAACGPASNTAPKPPVATAPAAPVAEPAAEPIAQHDTQDEVMPSPTPSEPPSTNQATPADELSATTTTKQKPLLARCKLPRVTGHCRARFQKYYFDRESSSCREFTYGGCGGNANRFDTKRACVQTCNP